MRHCEILTLGEPYLLSAELGIHAKSAKQRHMVRIPYLHFPARVASFLRSPGQPRAEATP